MSSVKQGKFTQRKLHISLNAEFLTNSCDAFRQKNNVFRPLHLWSPQSVNYKGPLWHVSPNLQL